MKDATGELSMTAVVIVIIGILAVALPVIINQVVKTMERNANCSAAFGCNTSTCGSGNNTMQCQYVPENATSATDTAPIVCPCSE